MTIKASQSRYHEIPAQLEGVAVGYCRYCGWPIASAGATIPREIDAPHEGADHARCSGACVARVRTSADYGHSDWLSLRDLDGATIADGQAPSKACLLRTAIAAGASLVRADLGGAIAAVAEPAGV